MRGVTDMRRAGWFVSSVRRLALCLSFACALVLPGRASACNVPVFRYALERWPADPYAVIVFHRGPLAAADRAVVDVLGQHIEKAAVPANFELTLVDLDGKPDPEMVELFRSQPKAELPWVVVRYPGATRIEAPVWSGRLSADAAQALLGSPARREVARRLLAGETAVWLLLESGNETKDEAAARVLGERLAKLKKTLKLPELTDTPADRLAAEKVPLRIDFSVLRVSRRDPAERMLVQMLLHSEDDLAGRSGEPMAFPVFGRGRALYALVGKGINADTIDEAGQFLVGPCSCQVKRLNPGTDLLIAADWDALVEGRRVRDPEPLVGLSTLAAALQSVPPADGGTVSAAVEGIPPPAKEEAAGPAGWSLFRNLLLAVGAGAVLVVVLTLVLVTGRRAS